MKAPERVTTQRLVLRRPRPEDAEAIFERYASDADVTRFLAWPRHETIEASRAFLEFGEAQWQRWPAGPYLVESREDGRLLGSTGLAFESAEAASTGYVLAADAWAKGYATEALSAIAEIARDLGVTHLYAMCHANHEASWRVLEKCGFTREPGLRRDIGFPNLETEMPREALCYRLDMSANPSRGNRLGSTRGGHSGESEGRRRG